MKVMTIHLSWLLTFEPWCLLSSILTADLQTQWRGGGINMRKVSMSISQVFRDYHIWILPGKTTVNWNLTPVPGNEYKLYLIGWQLSSILITMETRCIQSLGKIYDSHCYIFQVPCIRTNLIWNMSSMGYRFSEGIYEYAYMERRRQSTKLL